MKILIIIGSNRKNGNTDRLMNLIQRNLQTCAEQAQQSLSIETIYLGQQNISFCRGCRVCFDKGEDKCPLKDDLLAIKGKMKSADGMVLASPVYVNDVSGLTKNWIDRLAHVCHRPEFAGKCAYLIATVGSSPTGHTLDTMKLALRTWGFHVVGQEGFKMHALMDAVTVEKLFQKETEKIARKFFQAIHRRSFTKPTFYSLMMFKIQQLAWQKADPQTVDYAYWKSQGWIDQDRQYYISNQAHPVKVNLARLTGSVIARFVS